MSNIIFKSFGHAVSGNIFSISFIMLQQLETVLLGKKMNNLCTALSKGLSCKIVFKTKT